MHFGQILHPYSHLSTDIPLTHLCEVVQSLGDLPLLSKCWMHFDQILDPNSHLSVYIPLAHLCEVVQSLGDLPRIRNMLLVS